MFRFRIEFGNLDKYFSRGISRFITHISKDSYTSGNVLFSDLTTIKTTNGKLSSWLAGFDGKHGYANGIGNQARFISINSFVQLTAHQIIIADSLNYCLRSLTRTDKMVSDYAGSCQDQRHVDGELLESRFMNPTSMVKGQGKLSRTIFVVDETAIRYVDTTTQLVGTLTEAPEFSYATGIVMDTELTMSLLVTAGRFIKRLTVSDSYDVEVFDVYALTRLIGWDDGDFATATFGEPQGVAAVGKGVYLMSGTLSSGRVRVVDTVMRTVSSICTGRLEFRSGSISMCSIHYPSTQALIGDTVYIGGQTAIYSLAGKDNTTNGFQFES